MNRAVRNMVQNVGLSLPQAADCASRNPAKALGLDGEIGGIALGKRADFALGKRADFAVLSADFDVLMTVVGGEIVYRHAL